MIPRALPQSALTTAPVFKHSDLEPGQQAVRFMLTQPLLGILQRQPNGTRPQSAAPVWGIPGSFSETLQALPRAAGDENVAPSAACAETGACGPSDAGRAPSKLTARDTNAASAPQTGGAARLSATSGAGARPALVAPAPVPHPIRAPGNAATGGVIAPSPLTWTPAAPALSAATTIDARAPSARSDGVGSGQTRPTWEETLYRASLGGGGGSGGASRSAPPSVFDPRADAGFALRVTVDKENGGAGGGRSVGGAFSSGGGGSVSGGRVSVAGPADVAVYALQSGSTPSEQRPGGSVGSGFGDDAATPRQLTAGGSDGGGPWLAALHTTSGTASSLSTAQPSATTTPSPPAASAAVPHHAVPSAPRQPLAPLAAPPPPAPANVAAPASKLGPKIATHFTPFSAQIAPSAAASADVPLQMASVAAALPATAALPPASLNDSLKVLHAALSLASGDAGGTLTRSPAARGSPGAAPLASARLQMRAASPSRGVVIADTSRHSSAGFLSGIDTPRGVPPPPFWVTTWVDYR